MKIKLTGVTTDLLKKAKFKLCVGIVVASSLLAGCGNKELVQENKQIDDLIQYNEVKSDVVINFIDNDSSEKDIVIITQKDDEYLHVFEAFKPELTEEKHETKLSDGKYYVYSKTIGKEVTLDVNNEENNKYIVNFDYKNKSIKVNNNKQKSF